MLFSLSPPSSLLKLPIVVIQRFCYHGNMTFTLLLSIKSTQIFVLSCPCRWMKNHLCHLFTRLKIHRQITVLSSLSDIYVQNYRHMYYECEKVWVPLLQLLVNSFCLFIYYYYIIIIIIIIIIVIIIVIVIIIIISCIFFCRKHKQTSGRGKISVPRY